MKKCAKILTIYKKHMKKVDKAILIETANTLLFDLSDESYDILIEEISALNAEMDKISISELSNVEPMTFPFEINVKPREDNASKPLSKEDVLKNAGEVKDGQIKIPKVIK